MNLYEIKYMRRETGYFGEGPGVVAQMQLVCKSLLQAATYAKDNLADVSSIRLVASDITIVTESG